MDLAVQGQGKRRFLPRATKREFVGAWNYFTTSYKQVGNVPPWLAAVQVARWSSSNDGTSVVLDIPKQRGRQALPRFTSEKNPLCMKANVGFSIPL